jgi:hypothetical protein
VRRLARVGGLLLVASGVVHAHDPYEISSVVYLRSNRIELVIEMEFPTGMTLAGQKPSRAASPQSQFEAALPELEKFAGGFFEFTAGNHAVSPLRTNVQLGVEDHIQYRVEFAPTDYRPLRFDPRGLRRVEESLYGVSLTVLDMVNQKVLGQTTLFADSPAAEFPVPDTGSRAAPRASPTLAVSQPNPPPELAATTNTPPEIAGAVEPRRSRLVLGLAIFATLGVLLLAWFWMKARG